MATRSPVQPGRNVTVKKERPCNFQVGPDFPITVEPENPVKIRILVIISLFENLDIFHESFLCGKIGW